MPAFEKPVLVHPKAYYDLDHENTINTISSFCKTKGGAQIVKEIMCSPTYCIKTLKSRAKDIQNYIKKQDLEQLLEHVSYHEEGATWCSQELDSMDEDTLELMQEPYFSNPIAKPLNSIWPALWANNAYAIFVAPAMSLVAPLSYMLAPYFMIRFKLKIPLDFKTFIKLMYHSFKGAGAAMNIAFGNAPSFAMQLASVACTCIMYVQAVLATFRHSLSLVSVCTRIVTKMNDLCHVLETSKNILKDKTNSFFSKWIVFDKEQVPNLGPIPVLRSTKIYPWQTGYARALCQFKKLDRLWICSELRKIFCIDAINAISNCVNTFSLKPVKYLPKSIESLMIINGKRLNNSDVENDVCMMKGKNGIVLTGPNASGKSTILRMTGCVVMLAQTIGWTTAICAIRPFKYLTTMMGIRDDPQAGMSRFQNELLRAGECVEAARNRPDDIGLLLMDEIFGGTDPMQGDACGNKILSSLSETPGCMHILATHQKGLVEHSFTINAIKQYKMTPESYKMVEGVNDYFNANLLFDKMSVNL
ncbi:DNA mismatch repair ATPase MutS subfamily 8 [Tetraselmis virus 1]|uniref:DNA mismatch repair ATPase MutS subfamily 8 n=1 Tax=Tetraselmis virus 1 TaxID=2060617 RepID=A0A2P0VMZ2_9VIRU|nr:DNA mismatch repair ATPase MutS subfamily 8 [Tetraselmis virus 1]AUF82261.1 DNA mismatch repair ATPase MutS subfamily 8 [Tetraselmis virus 1]